DLFRFKGVLSIKGMPNKFVFQGVHMLFDGGFTSSWKPGEKRENRMTFIGKKLPWDDMKKKFMGCVVEGELRSKIGDAVECHLEDGYVQGTVAKQWEEGNPYRIKLVNGGEVWAPIDADEFIRAAK